MVTISYFQSSVSLGEKMTEFEHALVGYIVLMLIFHLFLKRHFKLKIKDKNEWHRIIGNFF